MNETLSFILVCIGIVTGLIVLCIIYERLCLKSRRKLGSAKYVATISMCGALAALLMLIEVPLLFLAPSFYKLDLSELPVMICGMYLGPTAAVLCEFLKILLKLLLKPTTTVYVGELANFLVGCALVVPASAIYHLRKTKKNAIIGLIGGTLTLTVFGTLFNAFYLLPTFAELFGMELDAIIAMGSDINASIHDITSFVIFSVAPLNLIKGVVISVLTMLLYKRVERLFFDFRYSK